MMANAMNHPVRAATDLRLLRAALFSAVCVALSAGGHVWASGRTIPLWSLATAWVGLLCLVHPLAGRERTLPGITSSLLTGEGALHTVFCLGQFSAPSTPADSASPVVALARQLLCHAGPLHLTPVRAELLLRQAGIDPTQVVHGGHDAAPDLVAMASMSLTSMCTPQMLAAHVTAALLAGWALRRCEVALWRAVRLPALSRDFLACLTVLATLHGLLRSVLGTAATAMTDPVRRLRRVLRSRRRADECSRLRKSASLRVCVVRRGPPAVEPAA